MIKHNQSITFTLTIFLSAYLLFSIQPMVGKSLLPILGGTPSVWNTAMVFFQVLLLLGYLYAHLLVKIQSLKKQFIVHGVVLLTAFLTLPMTISFLPPADSTSPFMWQISTMIGMIGLPFLALSTSAPLLQKWFSFSHHPNAHNPYFLYSASNVGSLLALILYPVLVERFFPLPDQTYAFQIGFGLLAVCILICGLSLQKNKISISTLDHDHSPTPSLKDMGVWLFLAFVPSSLMLGFTSFVTTDIGSTPLFWVVPLSLYILSFILAFATHKFISLTEIKLSFLFLFLTINVVLNVFIVNYKWELAVFHGILFFITALMCHQQLDKIKPSPKYLTLFFLIISIGGACGGIFNALIAPLIFLKPYEYTLVSALALICWGIGEKHKYLIAVGIFLMTINPVIPWESSQDKIIYISRNYFGTLTVRDDHIVKSLAHGTTTHGSQIIDQKLQLIPTTYYHFNTAIGEAFGEVRKKSSKIEVAALGLGVGSVSCLLRPTDHLTFIEIDPDIIQIAENRNLFTYVSDCKTPVTIIQGDARLKLGDQPDKKFDYILVDVFSGDSIPMHLITTEAVDLYLQKIKTDGMIAFHISNRYMRLAREVGLLAKSAHIDAYHKISEGGTIKNSKIPYFQTDVVVLTNNPVYAQNLLLKGWKKIKIKTDELHPWTDTYANPLRALFNH